MIVKPLCWQKLNNSNLGLGREPSYLKNKTVLSAPIALNIRFGCCCFVVTAIFNIGAKMSRKTPPKTSSYVFIIDSSVNGNRTSYTRNKEIV